MVAHDSAHTRHRPYHVDAIQRPGLEHMLAVAWVSPPDRLVRVQGGQRALPITHAFGPAKTSTHAAATRCGGEQQCGMPTPWRTQTHAPEAGAAEQPGGQRPTVAQLGSHPPQLMWRV